MCTPVICTVAKNPVITSARSRVVNASEAVFNMFKRMKYCFE